MTREDWAEFGHWCEAIALGVGLTLLMLWCGYWLSGPHR